MGFPAPERILEMSRGMVKSYDRAYDELSNPRKPGKKYKVKKTK